MQVSWFGAVSTPKDAYILLEAARASIIPKISRRLTDLERIRLVRPGAVFIWEEIESGIKRWTDQCKWSRECIGNLIFLIYSEILSDPSREKGSGLLKQSFSAATIHGEKLHLIAYYDKVSLEAGTLPTVASDSRLANVTIQPNVYSDHRAAGHSDNATSSSQRELLQHMTTSRSASPPSPAASLRSRTPVPYTAISLTSSHGHQWPPKRSATSSGFPRLHHSSFPPGRPSSLAVSSPSTYGPTSALSLPPLSASSTSLPPLGTLFDPSGSLSPHDSPFPYQAPPLTVPISSSNPWPRRHSDQSLSLRSTGYPMWAQTQRSAEDQRQLDLLSGFLKL